MGFAKEDLLRIEAVMDESIKTEGYGTILIIDQHGASTFTTVGFADKGLPEMHFMIGVNPELGKRIYNSIVICWEEICKSKESVFVLRNDVTNVFGSKFAKIVELDTVELADRVECQTKRYGENGFRVKGIIFSDPLGHFPGDRAYRTDFIQGAYPVKQLH